MLSKLHSNIQDMKFYLTDNKSFGVGKLNFANDALFTF
jgi:hypothetical protein